jgi:hypothetical protein
MGHPGLGPDEPDTESPGERAARFRGRAEGAAVLPSHDGNAGIVHALLAIEARLASMEQRLALAIRKI